MDDGDANIIPSDTYQKPLWREIFGNEYYGVMREWMTFKSVYGG